MIFAELNSIIATITHIPTNIATSPSIPISLFLFSVNAILESYCIYAEGESLKLIIMQIAFFTKLALASPFVFLLVSSVIIYRFIKNEMAPSEAELQGRFE